MVGDVPGKVLGMLTDLGHKLQHGVITPEQLAEFLKKTKPTDSDVAKPLVSTEEFIINNVYNWRLFYQKFFNLHLDFSEVYIPKYPGRGWNLLIVAKGVTLEMLFQKYRAIYGWGWKWTDENLDQIVVSVRNSETGSYAVWVSDNQESDDDLKNLSANFVESNNIITETLAERLLQEFKFYNKTGKHLDVIGSTLCGDSRWNGLVPSVSWRQDDNGGGIHINWQSCNRSNRALGARRVII